jgi:hypothetical protein
MQVFLFRAVRRATAAASLALPLVGLGSIAAQSPGAEKSEKPKPFVVAEQGSFMAGGTVVTNPGTFDPVALTPDGQTIHGDHAYVQYQIPPDARKLPLVFWHGGGQFSKTWETTPDGREGFQNIFLRRGFAVYNLDQPRRGRAGRATVNATVNAVPGPGATGEQGIFVRFRLGLWQNGIPNYFPNVQFSHDPEALNQWWRQQTPDIGGASNALLSDGVAAVFARIGPAILVTHSAGGLPGWLTQIKSSNVKAIVAYEPVGWVFPEGEVPAPIPTTGGPITGNSVPVADFQHLTQVPIQVIYGDNIPVTMGVGLGAYPGLDLWRGRLAMARLFVDAVNRHGGNATLLHLPDLGITGNTHFVMSDLNNLQIADLLSRYLKEKGLDRR